MWALELLENKKHPMLYTLGALFKLKHSIRKQNALEFKELGQFIKLYEKGLAAGQNNTLIEGKALALLRTYIEGKLKSIEEKLTEAIEIDRVYDELYDEATYCSGLLGIAVLDRELKAYFRGGNPSSTRTSKMLFEALSKLEASGRTLLQDTSDPYAVNCWMAAMIYCIAVTYYDYVHILAPRRSPVIRRIFDSIEGKASGVSMDTLRKYIKRGKELVEKEDKFIATGIRSKNIAKERISLSKILEEMIRALRKRRANQVNLFDGFINRLRELGFSISHDSEEWIELMHITEDDPSSEHI